MRVYDTNLTGTSTAETGRAQELQKTSRSQSGPSTQPGGSGAGDRVEFSGALGRLSKVLAAADQDRAGKVQALKAQYQSGKYRPDSLATSRAMISDALQTGSSQAGLG